MNPHKRIKELKKEIKEYQERIHNCSDCRILREDGLIPNVCPIHKGLIYPPDAELKAIEKTRKFYEEKILDKRIIYSEEFKNYAQRLLHKDDIDFTIRMRKFMLDELKEKIKNVGIGKK